MFVGFHVGRNMLVGSGERAFSIKCVIKIKREGFRQQSLERGPWQDGGFECGKWALLERNPLLPDNHNVSARFSKDVFGPNWSKDDLLPCERGIWPHERGSLVTQGGQRIAIE